MNFARGEYRGQIPDNGLEAFYVYRIEPDVSSDLPVGLRTVLDLHQVKYISLFHDSCSIHWARLAWFESKSLGLLKIEPCPEMKG